MAAENWGQRVGRGRLPAEQCARQHGPSPRTRAVSTPAATPIRRSTRLTDKAMSTIDSAAREQLLIQAVQLASDDQAIIPLYQLKNLWATRRPITYTPRPDQRTLAMDAHTVAP